MLRTNLQFLDLDHQPRCLVISSALQGEGKTMTSTNLAIALAQTGRRTLLIDGDLRRPRVAGQLGLDAAVGLTTVLVGNTAVQEAIQVHEPSGLHFLASGAKPPNPTEILQSRVTQELIRELSDSYDMVIIDGPPLLPGRRCLRARDHRRRRDPRDPARQDDPRRGRRRGDPARAGGGRLFSIAVNMIPKRATGGYYYYYYEESTRPARKPAKEPRPRPARLGRVRRSTARAS